MTNSKEYMRRYRATHREKFAEYRRQYCATHREEIRTCQKAWQAKHPLGSIWRNMMMRCGLIGKVHTKNHIERYIKRNITVCEEWRNFQTFEKWALANGWKKGLQIDRIDNDKGYSPDNCRFVTQQENLRNKSNTVKVRGIPLIEYYDAYANKAILDYRTFSARVVKLNWPVERALYTPVRDAKPHDTQDLPDEWYEQMELSAVQYYSDQFSK